MEHPLLVPATEKNISTIAELARLIWNQHYPSIIGQKQVDYMLNKMYSTSSLKEQMSDKGHRFFLVQNNDKHIGFISVNRVEKDNWFLNKFYIDQNKSRHGLGSAAYKQLITIISPSKITLTVNRQNYKAINFYFKNGFQIEKVADFDIGEGYVMNDFVMSAKID